MIRHMNAKADYSQAGEQQIIWDIFSLLQYPHYKMAVDIGARDGSQFSNIKFIAERLGWRRAQFDIKPLHHTVTQANVTPHNVNTLLSQHGATSIDLLSLDIDGNDWWVWQAIKYLPVVVVLEYNQSLNPESCVTIPYTENHEHDMTDWYGASFSAVVKLSAEKGYTLVAVTRVNAIFVRSDHANKIPEGTFNLTPLHQRVWKKDELNRPWIEV